MSDTAYGLWGTKVPFIPNFRLITLLLKISVMQLWILNFQQTFPEKLKIPEINFFVHRLKSLKGRSTEIIDQFCWKLIL